MSNASVPPPDLDVARQVLAAQPFSALLDARLIAFGDGAAELVVPLGERTRQQDGVAHGGVIAYAADNALRATSLEGLTRPAAQTLTAPPGSRACPAPRPP